jgi:hypothetical protein
LLIGTSCEKEETKPAKLVEPSPIHTLKIVSPYKEVSLNLTDSLEIHILAETSGESLINHASIRIIKKLDNKVIYEEPKHTKAYTTEGIYEFKDKFLISDLDQVESDTEYLIEARIWGQNIDSDFLSTSVNLTTLP